MKKKKVLKLKRLTVTKLPTAELEKAKGGVIYEGGGGSDYTYGCSSYTNTCSSYTSSGCGPVGYTGACAYTGNCAK